MKTKDDAPQLKLITWRPTEKMYDKEGNQFKGANDKFIAEDDLYSIAKKMTELPMYMHPWRSIIKKEFKYDPSSKDDQYVKISDVISILYGLTHDVNPGKSIVLDTGKGV